MNMTQTEVCRRLHDMVDQLADIPPDLWDVGLVTMRVTLRKTTGSDDDFTLVVGVEAAKDSDD